MSFNPSAALTFEDVREAFEKALAAPKGIRIPCTSRAAAISLRARFNYFRKADRMENRKVYDTEHPLHNRSVYDALQLRIPPAGNEQERVLFIEKRTAENFTIEEIE